jgi:hypothetical protein
LASASGAQIHVVVLPQNARYSGSRKPETHADIATVTALLDK